MPCTFNMVEEAAAPLLESQHSSLLPTAVPWPQEPALPRKGAHPGRGYVGCSAPVSQHPREQGSAWSSWVDPGNAWVARVM